MFHSNDTIGLGGDSGGFIFSGGVTTPGGASIDASVATGAPARTVAQNTGIGLGNPVVLILLIAIIVVAFR